MNTCHITRETPWLCQKCEKGSLIRKIERAGATQNTVWTGLCSAFIVSTLRVTVSNATVAYTQEVLFPSIKETGLWHKESAFGLDDAVSGKRMIYLSITVIIPRVAASAKPMHSVFTFYHVLSYCVVSRYLYFITQVPRIRLNLWTSSFLILQFACNVEPKFTNHHLCTGTAIWKDSHVYKHVADTFHVKVSIFEAKQWWWIVGISVVCVRQQPLLSNVQ